MSLLERLNTHAGRVAQEVQTSLRRAKAEGERRLLQRQHRAALEELGERAYELVRSGVLPGEPLAQEVAAVERKLMELEAASAEADGLWHAADTTPPPTRPAGPDDTSADTPGPTTGSGPGPGWEAASRFFPRAGDGDGS